MKSCKKATYLMSKQQDTQLNLIEKLSLKLHITLCKNCKACNQQLSTLHDLYKQHDKNL